MDELPSLAGRIASIPPPSTSFVPRLASVAPWSTSFVPQVERCAAGVASVAPRPASLAAWSASFTPTISAVRFPDPTRGSPPLSRASRLLNEDLRLLSDGTALRSKRREQVTERSRAAGLACSFANKGNANPSFSPPAQCFGIHGASRRTRGARLAWSGSASVHAAAKVSVRRPWRPTSPCFHVACARASDNVTPVSPLAPTRSVAMGYSRGFEPVASASPVMGKK